MFRPLVARPSLSAETPALQKVAPKPFGVRRPRDATAIRQLTTSSDSEPGGQGPVSTLSLMPRPVALITGPTSGIGAGYARRYARDGYDLVLVARDVDRLKQLAGELEAGAGRVEVLPADLADPAGREKVAGRLAAGVRVLVNNAGFATSGEFWATDPELLQAQLDVNVTAVMHLTRAALPAMLHGGKGTIINIASVAGMVPGRGSTYSASKAWVISFSEGLAVGLHGTGVGVHAVCPGYVHTEFHTRAGLDMPKLPSFLWLEVDDVVDQSLADIAVGKVISIPGVQYKAIVTVGRMIPRGLARAVTARVGGGRGRT